MPTTTTTTEIETKPGVAVHKIYFSGLAGAIFLCLGLSATLYVIGFATASWSVDTEVYVSADGSLLGNLTEAEKEAAGEPNGTLHQGLWESFIKVPTHLDEVEGIFCEGGYGVAGDHCYKAGDSALNYNDSQDFCEQDGGYLITITSEQEQADMIEYLKSNGAKEAYYWLGFVEPEEEEGWVWENGEISSYTAWNTGSGQPNNEAFQGISESQDCAAIGSNVNKRLWFDTACELDYSHYKSQPSFKNFPLCENEPRTPLEGWMKATQALISIGLVGLFLCIILACIYLCVHTVSKNATILSLVIFCFLTVIFMVVGFCVYGSQKGETLNWSFAISVIASFFCLLAGILGIVQMRKSGVRV